MLAVILFIAIPLTLIVWFVVNKIQQAEWNVNEIIAPAKQMFDIIEQRFGIDLLTQDTISFVGSKLTALGQSIIGGIGSFFVNLWPCCCSSSCSTAGGNGSSTSLR